MGPLGGVIDAAPSPVRPGGGGEPTVAMMMRSYVFLNVFSVGGGGAFQIEFHVGRASGEVNNAREGHWNRK